MSFTKAKLCIYNESRVGLQRDYGNDKLFKNLIMFVKCVMCCRQMLMQLSISGQCLFYALNFIKRVLVANVCFMHLSKEYQWPMSVLCIYQLGIIGQCLFYALNFIKRVLVANVCFMHLSIEYQWPMSVLCIKFYQKSISDQCLLYAFINRVLVANVCFMHLSKEYQWPMSVLCIYQ